MLLRSTVQISPFRSGVFALAVMVIGAAGSTHPISTASAIPIGLFVGNPDGNASNKMAAFQKLWDASVLQLGRSPQYFETFVDYGLDWNQWPNNAGWTAWSWRQSGRAANRLPVIGMRLSTNAYWNRQQDAFRGILAGQHDEVYRAVVAKWRDAGFRELRIRLSYEFDGNFMPDNFGHDEPTLVLWRAAFAHVADVLHRVPGVRVLVVWNPASINWAAHAVADAYPGDRFVDVIASDLYSRVYPQSLHDWSGGPNATTAAGWAHNPVNRVHFWDYPGATEWSTAGSGWGLVQAMAFAHTHGKPFAVSETGVGSPGPATGPADDPAFPANLRDRLLTFTRDGGNIDHVIIWDYDAPDGGWRFTGIPAKAMTAAAWTAFAQAP